MPKFTHTNNGFVSFEEGVNYDWEVEQATELVKNGNEYFDIRCRELESGGKWSLKLYFTEKSYPIVSMFMTAIGMAFSEGQEVNVTPAMVEGKRFSCPLKNEPYEKDGQLVKNLRFNSFEFGKVSGSAKESPPAKASAPEDNEPF